MPRLPKIVVVGGPKIPAPVRWIARGTPVDYTFYSTPRSLDDVLSENGCEDSVQNAADLLVFGECVYADGGGATVLLASRRSDGKVFGIDTERVDPLKLINSSREAFDRTFSLLDSVLRDGKSPPDDVEQSVRSIDPDAYDESDWCGLVDHLSGR